MSVEPRSRPTSIRSRPACCVQPSAPLCGLSGRDHAPYDLLGLGNITTVFPHFCATPELDLCEDTDSSPQGCSYLPGHVLGHTADQSTGFLIGRYQPLCLCSEFYLDGFNGRVINVGVKTLAPLRKSRMVPTGDVSAACPLRLRNLTRHAANQLIDRAEWALTRRTARCFTRTFVAPSTSRDF